MRYNLKTPLLIACLSGISAGCASQMQPETESMKISNPASAYCIEQGGKLEPRKDAAGNDIMMCHLNDGTVIEEWEFFRRSH